MFGKTLWSTASLTKNIILLLGFTTSLQEAKKNHLRIPYPIFSLYGNRFKNKRVGSFNIKYNEKH